MAQNSRGGLFRTRNILGTALVAGIGFGIFLGQFKGFGLGGSGSLGIGGTGSEVQSNVSADGPTTSSTDSIGKPAATVDDPSLVVSDVVKVVIDDRMFLLRQEDKDVTIELPKLIQLIKQVPGDKDGYRVRIYEKSTARASAEESLKKALAEAEIPDTVVLWVPSPVK